MDKTRSLANLIQSARAFQESRTLLTALELDVFTTIGEGALAAEVAQRLGTDPRATEMLLNALVALGALGKRDAVFRCTVESEALGPARPGLLHMVHLWDTWTSLTECVKSGKAIKADGDTLLLAEDLGQRDPALAQLAAAAVAGLPPAGPSCAESR
jgi:hypothetical protein